MRVITRRRLLQVTGAGVVSSVVGYAGLQRSRPALRRWLVTPELPEGPTGPLSEPTVQTLLATTETLLQLPVEKDRYEAFFRWRSENVPGYRNLYEQFVSTLDKAAKESAAVRFADAERPVRRKVLARSFQAGNPSGDFGQAWAGLFNREWLLYDRYITREVFDLFARTDAWIKLGYETWPGEHRGLYTYTQPPAGVTNAVDVNGDDS